MRNSLLLLTCLCLFACTSNKQTREEEVNNTDTVKYSYKDFNLKHSMCDTVPDSLCNVYVKANYPVFEGKNEAINAFIDTLISYNPSSENPKPNGIQNAAKGFLADYSILLKEVPNMIPGYSWEQNVKVTSQKLGLITLTYDSYTYTAGAHGSEETYFYNYDLKAKRALKLEDILIANYNTQLLKVAEEIFRNDEGLSATESIEPYFSENNKFELCDNFLIKNEGLLFLYNIYEIKSYAEGTTELFIPYSRIKDIINPNGKLKNYIN